MNATDRRGEHPPLARGVDQRLLTSGQITSPLTLPRDQAITVGWWPR
jgi:hypothetical protein